VIERQVRHGVSAQPGDFGRPQEYVRCTEGLLFLIAVERNDNVTSLLERQSVIKSEEVTQQYADNVLMFAEAHIGNPNMEHHGFPLIALSDELTHPWVS
jgi:hypothetical protein